MPNLCEKRHHPSRRTISSIAVGRLASLAGCHAISSVLAVYLDHTPDALAVLNWFAPPSLTFLTQGAKLSCPPRSWLTCESDKGHGYVSNGTARRTALFAENDASCLGCIKQKGCQPRRITTSATSRLQDGDVYARHDSELATLSIKCTPSTPYPSSDSQCYRQKVECSSVPKHTPPLSTRFQCCLSSFHPPCLGQSVTTRMRTSRRSTFLIQSVPWQFTLLTSGRSISALGIRVVLCWDRKAFYWPAQGQEPTEGLIKTHSCHQRPSLLTLCHCMAGPMFPTC